MNVKIYFGWNAPQLPQYKSEAASGMDLCAAIPGKHITLLPGDRVLIGTGIFLEIPKGYEGQIRPRSGLAYTYGITVLNTPGTIDSDYRGEVKVLLINHSKIAYNVHNGDRIAQLVFAKVEQAQLEVVGHLDDLNSTARDNGGFGSTGK